MIEHEARELLLDNLRKARDQNSALCATQRAMIVKILQEIAGESIGKKAMMNLRILADAKSRLSYYRFANHDNIGGESKFFYKGFVNIIKLWEEIMNFVMADYTVANIKKNTGRSLKEIEHIVADIKNRRSNLENQIQNSGKFVFSVKDRDLLNRLIDWAMRLIMGYDLFDVFVREYSRLVDYLNLYLKQSLTDSQS